MNERGDGGDKNKRREAARAARMEAERLALQAERARVEAERAQLELERKRLERDKARSKMPAKGADAEEASAASTAEPLAKPPADVGAAGLPSVTGGLFNPSLAAMVPRVSEEDIKTLKETVMSMDTFFVTSVDRSMFADRVVFRGNLRTTPEKALASILASAKSHGLSDRVRLFLMQDPAARDDTTVVVAIPSEAAPPPPGVQNKLFAVLGVAVAAFTTLSYGVGIFGVTPEFVNAIAIGNTDVINNTLPLSLGTAVVTAAHEVGHRVVAKARGVKLGLPFFLPSLQIGSYGSVTPLADFPPSRKHLFDVAAAGPAAGFALSLAAVVAGLLLTSSGEVADWFPQVPAGLFRASLLLGSLAEVLLPAGFRDAATVAVDPLVVVGYTGLLVNALNMLPIGRLDGGRVALAALGRQASGLVSWVSLIAASAAALLGDSPLLLYWSLLVVFFQREAELPCTDEVTPLDTSRQVGAVALLVLAALVLVPFPDSLTNVTGQF